MASVFPTLLTFAERRMKISGRVSSWFFAASGLGGMMVPWLIGQVFETVGPGSTMITILIDLLLGLVIFVGVVYFSRPRSARAAYLQSTHG
jgi:fucose permease